MMRFPLKIKPAVMFDGGYVLDASDKLLGTISDMATAERIVALANDGHRVEQLEADMQRAAKEARRVGDLEGALTTLCDRDVSYHDGEVRIQFGSHAEAMKAMRVAREAVSS